MIAPVRYKIQLLLVVTLMLCNIPVPAAEQTAPMQAVMDEFVTEADLHGAVYQSQYILGAGDVLQIEDGVMGAVAERAIVLSDGSINLPLIGKVYLGGLTAGEARTLLNEKYGKFYVKPSVSLYIVSERPVRVYVQGAVNNPGVYASGKNTSPENQANASLGAYDQLTLYQRMYLADALMLAGGLAYNANLQDVRIHRAFPKPVTIHVNVWDLFKKGNLLQDLPLRDQDVVEIPELAHDAIVMNPDWKSFYESNVAESLFRVSVLGAVKQPGPYDVESNDSVLTAIAKAGGFREDADKNKIYILRTTTAGQIIKREVDMSDKGLIGKKPFQAWAGLLPDDVVLVAESGKYKAAKSIGETVDAAGIPALYPLLNRLFDN